MNWLIFYDKETLQIEQYISSSSIMPTPASLSAYNPDKHNMVELIDPPFKISRDHKVALKEGKIVDTASNPNPKQPPPPEPHRNLATEIEKLKTRIDALEVKGVKI